MVQACRQGPTASYPFVTPAASIAGSRTPVSCTDSLVRTSTHASSSRRRHGRVEQRRASGILRDDADASPTAAAPPRDLVSKHRPPATGKHYCDDGQRAGQQRLVQTPQDNAVRVDRADAGPVTVGTGLPVVTSSPTTGGRPSVAKGETRREPELWRRKWAANGHVGEPAARRPPRRAISMVTAGRKEVGTLPARRAKLRRAGPGRPP